MDSITLLMDSHSHPNTMELPADNPSFFGLQHPFLNHISVLYRYVLLIRSADIAVVNLILDSDLTLILI